MIRSVPPQPEREPGDDTEEQLPDAGLRAAGVSDERIADVHYGRASRSEVLREVAARVLVQDSRERIRTRREEQLHELTRRSRESWISLRIGDRSIADIPQGAHVVIDGPTGAGKTTLAIAMAVEHALHVGPAIYLSLELDAATVRARAIGQRHGVTWREVLTGTVDEETMRDVLPERLDIIDGERVGLSDIGDVLAQSRAAWPGHPVLVVIDYVQLVGLLGSDTSDMRAAAANAAEYLRTLGERERVGMILVSQPSRQASRDLRSRDRVGADTIGVSGETGQLERGATVTLALGGDGTEDARGWRPVSLSTGKSRYGGGDRVWTLRYHGASGQWRVDGEPRSGTEVRETLRQDRAASAAVEKRARVVAVVDASDVSMTRGEIAAKVGGKAAVVRDAISAALADKELVECPSRPKSDKPTLWTPRRVR